MTKKSQKTTAKQPEPAKKEEPAKPQDAAAAKSNNAGLGAILLSRVKELEMKVKDIGSGQAKMIGQYDAFTKSVDERILHLTNNAAFGEGMRFLIVLAENNLAKQLKLPDRNALANDGRNLPSWWLVTLMQCYDYLPTKPIQPSEDKASVVADIVAKQETVE